ncbi:hypothetical protein N0V90_011750 [Kalmusia sp. IMI 367209]|nr:hypothetical protein N0V90_011750 [Kalmusia sp. IMI 367209]
MPSISTIVLALSAVAAAAPLSARDVCGVAPSATGATKTPLATFTDAKTAQECFADCESNSSCQSFLFGLVDGTVKCELFDVPAAQIPKQDSANLIAFDKACSSIPDVQPTTANPQGLETGSGDNSQTDGQNGGDSNTNNGQTGSNSQPSGQTGSNTQQSQPNKQTKRATCGAAPAGSGSAQPFNTPANINSLEACIEACKQNPTCKSVEFGKPTPDGANVCHFFSVEAAQIPKATTGQSFQVSDVAC